MVSGGFLQLPGGHNLMSALGHIEPLQPCPTRALLCTIERYREHRFQRGRLAGAAFANDNEAAVVPGDGGLGVGEGLINKEESE